MWASIFFCELQFFWFLFVVGYGITWKWRNYPPPPPPISTLQLHGRDIHSVYFLCLIIKGLKTTTQKPREHRNTNSEGFTHSYEYFCTCCIHHKVTNLGMDWQQVYKISHVQSAVSSSMFHRLPGLQKQHNQTNECDKTTPNPPKKIGIFFLWNGEPKQNKKNRKKYRKKTENHTHTFRQNYVFLKLKELTISLHDSVLTEKADPSPVIIKFSTESTNGAQKALHKHNN